MSRQLGICLLMVCFMTSFGCTLKTVDTFETGDKTIVTNKVLIVTQKSRYKSEVVSEMGN